MSQAVGARRLLPARVAWRTVDIVVLAVVAAVFGAIYWAVGLLQSTSLFGVFPPLAAILNVVFLMAGPLGALIIRRPGAALAAELLAALFEALVSVSWSGSSIIVYGLLEGAAAELGFLLFVYRRWSLEVALLSGALSGAAMALLDVWIYGYYSDFPADQKLAYLAIAMAAGAAIAGGVSWVLVRSLAATGVLAPFAAGRGQHLV
jgi:energy-coupling factor transport system substrate-specific component